MSISYLLEILRRGHSFYNSRSTYSIW